MICLEITKPETIERLQELLEEKLRRSLVGVPGCLEDAGGFNFELCGQLFEAKITAY